MDLHLITTDISCFDLIENSGSELNINCVIVPENRIKSEKVKRVIEYSEEMKIPISIHKNKSFFDNSIPTASAAISFLYSQIIKPVDLNRYNKGIINMYE